MCLLRSLDPDQIAVFDGIVRRRRIEAAARDLAAATATIAAVAAAHGFTDQSHFTRQFRRYMGLTPLEYRQRIRSPG